VPYVLSLILTDFLEDINCHGGKKSKALLESVTCEKCHQQGLKLTGSLVQRGAITLGEIDSIFVPLSKCPNCKSRRRVLPIDLLPGKPYSLPVIEKYIVAYNQGHYGLRLTVEKTKAGASKPHFTTLHGWLSGLGERVLDQVRIHHDRAIVGKPPLLEPFTALVQAIENHYSLPAASVFSAAVTVFPEKYRSQRRKEHLEADRRLLKLAALIPGSRKNREPQSFLSLERLGILEFRRPVLLFCSWIRDRPIQLWV